MPASSLHKINIPDPVQPDYTDSMEYQVVSKPLLFVEPDAAKQQALSDIVRIEKQLDIDPLREDQVQHQMLLCARTGNFAGSLRAYTQLQRRFADELGIDPLPETLSLRDRILSARLSPLHNLKPDSSQFVGREEEMNAISSRLTSEDCRMLTLFGLGGMGKTRLSIAVIRKLASADWRYFLHGIWFVPLAPINAEADPQALIYAIANACNIPISGNQSTEEQVFNWFSDREALLVLDNFEHIIGQAVWIDELLNHAPNLKILATSRQRLNIADEHIFPIFGFNHTQTLPHASPREMLDDASRLFLLTSRKLQPNFRPDQTDLQNIRKICNLVNGMPLGIELAASWTRMLSCQEIVNEIQSSIDFLESNLRRLPDRHRSMRAVFAYSWDLLTPGEQDALMSLSLIRGPFTLDTAQSVGEASLELITKLIDKSLIQASSGSASEDTTSLQIYSLHEITRHYARELLKESVNNWEKANLRYQNWFVNLLIQQFDSMYGPEQFEAATNIDFAFNDMLYSWQESLNQLRWNELDLVKAAGAIGRYFNLKGLDRLGADVFGKALDILPTAAPKRLKMTMQTRMASFLHRLSDFAEAENIARMALEVAQETEDYEEIPRVQLILSQAMLKTGRFEESIELGKSALATAETQNNNYRRAISHNLIGTHSYASGQYADAFFHWEAALKLFTELGHEDHVWLVRSNMALPSAMVGQYEQAIEIFQKELEVSRKWNNKQRLATTLMNLAWVRSFVQEFEQANDEIDEGLVYYREMGNAEGEATAFIVMGHIDIAREDYVPARAHFLDALRIAHRIQAIPKVAESIAGLALFVYELDGETELAWKIAKFCQTKAHLGPMVFSRSQTVLERIGDEISAEKQAELSAIAETYELNQVAMALMHHQLGEL